MFVFFPFILDVKFVGCTGRGHTGFLIHLPDAVLALIFLARRIQLFLFLVDREVEFCVLTIQSFSTCWAFFFFFFFFFFREEEFQLPGFELKSRRVYLVYRGIVFLETEFLLRKCKGYKNQSEYFNVAQGSTTNIQTRLVYLCLATAEIESRGGGGSFIACTLESWPKQNTAAHKHE